MSCDACFGRSPKWDIGDPDKLDMAEARALMLGCGFSEEELKKPRIAVFNTLNPMNAGHIHQKEIADAIAKGVRDAGGLPVEFNGVNLCDSMGDTRYILPSRDLLVNDIDLMVGYHRMDAVVMIGSCDKVIPGLLMAAGRMDIPTIIVTGGFMKTAQCGGEDVDFIDIGISRSKYIEGKISKEEFEEIVKNAVPGGGACGMMGTGNTMGIITEVLGMSMPGNSTTAGRSQEMLELAYSAGRQVMQLLDDNITARRIITKESIANAIKTCMAIGGSGNTIVHVAAVAAEAEIDMELSEIYSAASFEVPLLVGIRPNGRHNMTDFANAGGIRALLNQIKGHLNTGCLTVNGKTIGENIAGCEILDSSVIHPIDDPISTEGGLIYVTGNLVPDGAFIKQSAVPKNLLKMRGPAHVFNNQADAIDALRTGKIKAGEIIVVRYVGPKAEFGTAYFFTSAVKGTDLWDKVATITDGCLSGAAQGAAFQYAAPEAALVGPLALVRDGDMIDYDLHERRLSVELSEEELQKRRDAYVSPVPELKGFLGIYQRGATSVKTGAILR